MKVKFLMLLAAMLLSSATAFAQSGNSEPLKGDVNGDEKVDVADIVAVLQIMKDGGGTAGETAYWFSAGVTPITEENYTTANNAIQVSAYEDEYYVTAETRSYIYILIASNMKPTLIEPTLQAPIDLIVLSDINIPGHTVYRSGGKCMGNNIPIRISQETKYYWYIGTENPMDMNSITNIVNDNSSPGWRLIGTTLPDYGSSNMLWNGAQNNISFGARSEYYLALPSNNLKVYNSAGDNEMDGCTSLGTKTINNIVYYLTVFCPLY